jgi:hypothetical protein
MPDKQFYVKVNFEFGVDEGGEFTPKNRGEAVWVSMPQVDVVALQNYAVIPALNMMSTKAGELGMAVAGIEMPDLSDFNSMVPPGQAKKA